MKIIETSIPDVKIIEPVVFGDERGFFLETFRDDWFRENIADVTFVQENHSKSYAGTLRGMHYQLKQAQGKLLSVVAGEVHDVVIDLRQNSNSFGRWSSSLLSSENKRQLWVPAGFAHGFYVTSQSAEFVYKCTDYYAPQFEKCISWDDPDLAIDWPITLSKKPLLSAKDEAGILFKNAQYY